MAAPPARRSSWGTTQGTARPRSRGRSVERACRSTPPGLRHSQQAHNHHRRIVHPGHGLGRRHQHGACHLRLRLRQRQSRHHRGRRRGDRGVHLRLGWGIVDGRGVRGPRTTRMTAAATGTCPVTRPALATSCRRAAATRSPMTRKATRSAKPSFRPATCGPSATTTAIG